MDDAQAIAANVRNGSCSARDVAEQALARAHAVDGRVRAFLYLSDAHILAQADHVDAKRRAGHPLGALAGVPIGVKDAFCTHDAPTTAGSAFLREYRPPYDATAVKRLRDADAIIFGKTNMDEFGMGSTTEWSAFHPTHNPWDLRCTPGGSSGGSAAAVAAGIVPLALGSDTGGSVRQPAAYTGLVGLKPSYGRIPRTGLIAYASSLDHVGVLARSVPDAILMLQTLAGADDYDATAREDCVANEVRRKVRVGIPREWAELPLEDSVRAALAGAIRTLEAHGAEIHEVRLPSTEHLVATYYVLACAEASSNLGRFDGIRFGARATGTNLREVYVNSRTSGFGAEVQRRILLGTFVLSSGHYDAYYERAARARLHIAREMAETFTQVDALLGPTTLTPAPKLGTLLSPLQAYRADVLTLPANLSGYPALSVPQAHGSTLPIGVQLVAKDETVLLALGAQLAAPWSVAPC
jgi:aspartyl-tRNA(Asn)/glutamyl-tRNA(Gln) amidotransferase subunit A